MFTIYLRPVVRCCRIQSGLSLAMPPVPCQNVAVSRYFCTVVVPLYHWYSNIRAYEQMAPTDMLLHTEHRYSRSLYSQVKAVPSLIRMVQHFACGDMANGRLAEHSL